MKATLRRALQLHQAGQLEEARRAYASRLDAEPDDADARHLLGLVCYQQGEPETAREHIARAVMLRPHDPVMHNNLGEALRALQRHDEAERAYRKAIELRPDYPEPHNNLAVILTARGHPAEARQHCERALSLRPEYAEAWYNLGLAWQQEGNWQQAVECYERCIDLGGHFADAFNNLALCRYHQGDWNAAEGFYREALERDPGHLPALNNLAELQEKAGRLEEAATLNRRALELAPGDPHAGLVAARLQLRADDLAGAVARLRDIATRDMPAPLEQAVQFELGQLLDRAGKHADAFQALTRAHALQAADARYTDVEPERFLQRVNDYRSAVDGLYWPSARSLPDAPVFLVGFPRSGTTLLDQILDSHPELQVMEERPCLETLQTRLEATVGGYPLSLNELDSQERDALRDLYFDRVADFLARRADALLVDKYPLNILRTPLIERVFPGARIILALRNPADVVLSCFMQQFVPNDAMANFRSLESSARAYAAVMDFWEACCRRLKPRFHVVRYEDLVEHFDEAVSGCLSFLELKWTDSVRDHARHARERRQITTPSYRQVTRPLYSSSLGRWRSYRAFFTEALILLEPWIRRYGYSAD